MTGIGVICTIGVVLVALVFAVACFREAWKIWKGRRV